MGPNKPIQRRLIPFWLLSRTVSLSLSVSHTGADGQQLVKRGAFVWTHQQQKSFFMQDQRLPDAHKDPFVVEKFNW